jgi:hypothetical protein
VAFESIMMASHVERKDVASIGGQLAMKPTSEQTRNGVLSAVPFPEELLILESSFRNNATAESVHVGAALHPTAIDPSLAYGCVDWYIYPDSKVDSVAA